MLVKLVKYYLNHESDTGLSIADDDIVLIVMYTAPHTDTHTDTHTYIEAGSPERLPQVCHKLEVWIPAFWKLDSPSSLDLVHKSLG